MTFHFRSCTKALAALAIVSLLVACGGDPTGGIRHMVQLSFATTTARLAANVLAGDIVVGAADNLTLTSAQLVFSEIELDRSGTVECIEDENDDGNHGDGRHGGDDDDFDDEDFDDDDFDDDDFDDAERDDDDCEEVLRQPTLVDLPLIDGQVSRVIEIPLPDGSFSEVEAKLEPANSLLDGRSVRVVGMFTKADGTVVPFVFTSRVRTKLEMEFNPPIDGSTTNATVSIDVRSWFLNSAGQVIDPRVADNRRRIESNIRRSFRAFEDNDRRGDDDHRGHHDD